MAGKYLGAEGVQRLWQRIMLRYDGKLDSVTNKDDTIEVTSGRVISVKVSPAENNLLKIDAGKGLFVAKMHKLTFGSDKNYVYDGTEDVTVPVYQGEYYEE